jgi:drug/metabolite transporter (DMT)-like permease
VWGFNMTAIKLSNEGIPPLLAATLRNIGAVVPVGLYLLWKGTPLVHRDRRALFGLIIGLLFGLDFLFFYGGSSLTNASRAVILVYMQPVWVALGAHVFLAGDRLTRRRAVGLFLALTGLASVFAAPSGGGESTLLGDLLELAAGMTWAATTVFIKATVERYDVPPSSTLFYQLLFSVPLLALGAVVFERGTPVTPTPLSVGALLFQTFVVAAASYAVWYWMIQRYQVTSLAAFTMVTPLFGVLAGWLVLGEALPPSLVLGLLLVSLGIYLVQAVSPRVLSRRVEEA